MGCSCNHGKCEPPSMWFDFGPTHSTSSISSSPPTLSLSLSPPLSHQGRRRTPVSNLPHSSYPPFVEQRRKATAVETLGIRRVAGGQPRSGIPSPRSPASKTPLQEGTLPFLPVPNLGPRPPTLPFPSPPLSRHRCGLILTGKKGRKEKKNPGKAYPHPSRFEEKGFVSTKLA
ncbi:hypothetical protein IE53DRAFT_49148 [Violaceomyces palustris]|uniref:Uncharacterized protein n=1 Tax=Violaceomyces palustris TaxID=1673888 RepID=A0ACD0P0E6_9BASI|nr:hypothetical protein IE53DRAFT_49148 [Violaceomyces palustris]